MAAEGLDIKSLSTLFMVTPMTRIEQSVGRILRQKHEFNPVIIDIIDTHANFQKQWLKRKTFYKAQNYKIIQTNSSTYVTDVSKWKIVYEPNASQKSGSGSGSGSGSKLVPELKSNSDLDTDLDTDSGSDSEPESNKSVGKCLLHFKK
jgi:superfamily II DNA or RNA helicase